MQYAIAHAITCLWDYSSPTPISCHLLAPITGPE